MKRIRIAHIAGGLTAGGVEAVIYNYCAKLQRDDYELVYISYDEPDSEAKERFERLGFTVYSVTKKRVNFLKSCHEVVEIFRRHNINIVHSHMTLMCFVTSFLAMLCGIRVRIAHSHLELQPTGLKRPASAFCKLLTRISSTDYFACGTEPARYLFGTRLLKSNKVFFLNNAVDSGLFAYNKTVREQIRQQLGIGNRFCVGHVGRFTEQKNHRFLLEIFACFVQSHPCSVLLLVGDGPLMDDALEQSKSLNIADSVIFAGTTNRIEAYYQAMDLFVLPSLYEGLALVRLEAQFAGLPVIVSDRVTSEMTFSDRVCYLPLEIGPQGWAEELARRMNESAEPSRKVFAESANNLRQEALMLGDFYVQAAKRSGREVCA